jgi:hypothetical protein
MLLADARIALRTNRRQSSKPAHMTAFRKKEEMGSKVLEVKQVYWLGMQFAPVSGGI